MVLSAQTPRLPLTLREAVQRAMEGSPEVAAERIYTQRADAALRAARGVFDPVIRLGGDFRRESRPSSSVLEAPNGRVDEHVASGSVSLQQKLPWNGISADGSFENLRQSSTNPFFALNPFYTPRVRFGLNIPLLRGRVTDAERTEIVVRRRESRLSRWELQNRLLERASRVVVAYWRLVGARQRLEAARQTRTSAADSLASTERLVGEGEQATAEVYGARGQLQRAEEALAEAGGAELQAQNALKLLLAASEQDEVLAASIDPADREAAPPGDGLEEQTARAWESRPDLRGWVERLEAQKARVGLASNDTLPRADLQFSYISQGLSGRPQDAGLAIIPGFDLQPPASLVGSTWSGLSQIRGNQFPTYAASLRIELPLRNRGAEGRLLEARLAERQMQLLQSQLKIQIALEVRQALDALSAAKARMRAAELAESASAERLASEFRLYREGQSNNLNLNIRQNELSESRQLTVQARELYNSATAELLRATGQTLAAFGIHLEEPAKK